MATTTLITIPVYQINSGPALSRTLFPYGNLMAFPGSSLQVQPNSFSSLQDLQAGRTAGAALVYSTVRSSVTPNTVYYSNLTVASIITLANA